MLSGSDSAPSSRAEFRLHLFGAFRLERGGLPVRLPTRKVESLLAYLALHPPGGTREHLAALLWGEAAPARAAASLRVALSALRRELGADLFLSDRVSVQLNPAFSLWVDAGAYQRAPAAVVAAGVSPVPADDPDADLYRGDLLVDFFDEWIVPLREQYRRLHLERLLGLAQALRGRSDYLQAIRVAERALAADATNETAHQHLIFCHLAAGDRAEAIAQYQRCRAVLQRELGVEPLPETTALYHWIRQAETRGGAPASRAGLPSNVPLPISSFVGRARELSALKGLLTDDRQRSSSATRHPPPDTRQSARLVTLTGPGGSGKTRLAIQACLDLLAARAFAHGVWWVGLASLEHEAHVPQAVAHALGLRKAPARALVETLIEHLRPRQALLVLDNCEHVLMACARLAERLLAACPQLRLITTSRERLGLTGEVVVAVHPLEVPAAATAYSPDALLALDAPRLFVERARAVRPGLEVGAAQVGPLAGLCRALDGIPLAIELAAAQTPTLSLEQLARRLLEASPLSTLTGGSRTALPRQQTLRATIQWSYDLLPEPEQALFRALAVFAGGWTLDAAQAVVGGRWSDHLLFRLVDKSLVVADFAASPTRYRYLDTIRAFAQEQLDAHGEAGAARRQHLGYYAALAARVEAEQFGPREPDFLKQVDDEIDNVRAALQAGLELPEAAAPALGLASNLLRYWTVRGTWREGREWLSGLLARVGPAPSRLRARGLIADGYLAWRLRDIAAARAAFDEIVAITRDPAHGAAPEQAHALRGLGLLAYAEGRHDEARRWMEAALASFRQVGDRAGVGFALTSLGELARVEGRYDEAAAYFTEQMALRRGEESELTAAIGLHNLGQVALARGQVGQARALLTESLRRHHRHGGQQGMADTLAALAALAAAEGAFEWAARWLAASQAWLRALGATLEPTDQLVFDRSLAAVRAQLPADAYDRAWAEGLAAAEAGAEQVVAEALAAYGPAPN
jgi:predicted ATPase/DNA-binding SARP family transcriptional activator